MRDLPQAFVANRRLSARKGSIDAPLKLERQRKNSTHSELLALTWCALSAIARLLKTLTAFPCPERSALRGNTLFRRSVCYLYRANHLKSFSQYN
jgi:hypothetical protein